jgi:glutamate 5-kinase
VARGLVNYDAAESRRILGLPSAKVQEALGYPGAPELIHRDNLVLS